MIKFVDMFSGIGGFREGLTRAGGFECVGHCEIDKYANRSYNALFDTKGEWFIEDARKADPSTMPDFLLLCGGFPCQTFSIAGSRKGFGDPRYSSLNWPAWLKRGSLRICCLKMYPVCYLMTEGGHLRQSSTRWINWGMVWNGNVLTAKISASPVRNRVYIVGYLDERCRGKYFLHRSNRRFSYSNPAATKGSARLLPEGLSCMLAANPGGFGGKTGLYEVGVPIKCATKPATRWHGRLQHRPELRHSQQSARTGW